MPNQAANNYQGGNSVGTVGYDSEHYIVIYNDTGSALAEGAVYVVTFANSGTAAKFPTIATPATDATGSALIGVVNNQLNGLTTIPDSKWGFLQIKGYCEKINMAGTVSTVDYALKAMDGLVTLTSEASLTTTAKTVAIAKSTCSGASTVSGYLLGFRVTI
jgi:hypothetical protein